MSVLATVRPQSDAETTDLELLGELGRGRSGLVSLYRDGQGELFASKLFDSHGVTKAVQIVLLGSPNPYIWNEAAVRCAYLRRRLLSRLVRCWFGDRLSVADAVSTRWDDDHHALELRTNFVKGRPPMLDNALGNADDSELNELLYEIMEPLQDHLVASGFAGLAWQAGMGNPVALNNFLSVDDSEQRRWAWIDLESGIPAVASPSLSAQFGFYLPRALAFRRPLFDDVDTKRQSEYLRESRAALESELGSPGYAELTELAAELAREQTVWKSQSRHERSIGYYLACGELTPELAQHYRERRLRWYGRLGIRAAGTAARAVGRAPVRAARALARVNYVGAARASARFLSSQRFREKVAHDHLIGRIAAWRRRRQIDRDEALHLREQLECQETGSYLTDFGVHIAVKPFVKILTLTLLPALFALGLISAATMGILIVAGGSIGRTVYTSGRVVQATVRGRAKPWIALATGVVPVLGNFAYPLQILYSSSAKADDLARFILADGFASIGRRLPIWGGRDTRTEHWFNRLPRHLWRRRNSDRAGAVDTKPHPPEPTRVAMLRPATEGHLRPFGRRLRGANAERRAAADPGITRVYYGLMSVNLIFLGVALFLWSPGEPRPAPFMEEGMVTVLSSVYLALTAAVALGCGLFYDRASRWGRAFWFAVGGVFLFLALDERLQFHERVGYALHDAADSGPFRNWNDVVVMGYGIAAVFVAIAFLSEIVRLPRFGALLGQAFLFYVIHTTIDSIWGSHYHIAPIPEESAKLLASSLFFIAMVAALTTMIRRARVDHAPAVEVSPPGS